MVKLILKFGTVGVINTILDYTILQVLVYIFDIKGGVFLLLANTTSSGISVINSFILNKKWTFQDKEEKYIKQFVVFVLVNLISIAINDTTILYLTHIAPAYFTILHHAVKSILITKLGAIVMTMFFNFFAYRLFVFKNSVEVYNEQVV